MGVLFLLGTIVTTFTNVRGITGSRSRAELAFTMDGTEYMAC